MDDAAQSRKEADAAAGAPPPPEVIIVDQTRVACDGGGGPLGHPKVWYSLADGRAECLYCDRLFIYDPEKARGA